MTTPDRMPRRSLTKTGWRKKLTLGLSSYFTQHLLLYRCLWRLSMRLLISFALVGAAAVALIACNSADKTSSSRSVTQATPSSSAATPAAAASAPADGVRRITTVELQDLIKKGQAFVVDVRNQASYDAGHVRGAKLIPNNEILNHVKELPRDKTIVTYCS
jgi:3-mercaptopyruvate sulfurtransferase SseA